MAFSYHFFALDVYSPPDKPWNGHDEPKFSISPSSDYQRYVIAVDCFFSTEVVYALLSISKPDVDERYKSIRLLSDLYCCACYADMAEY